MVGFPRQAAPAVASPTDSLTASDRKTPRMTDL